MGVILAMDPWSSADNGIDCRRETVVENSCGFSVGGCTTKCVL